MSLLPILTLSEDGRVVTYNEVAQSLFVGFGTIQNTNFFRLFPELAEMARHLENNQIDHFQRLLQWELPNHRENYIEIIAYLSPAEGNEHAWSLCIVEVTHWLRMVRHYALENERSEERQRRREWAHEVNNPLGGLLAATQWWQKSTLPKLPEALRDETNPIISMLLQEINRLRSLMSGVLHEEQETTQQWINPHQPLEHALTLFIHEFPEVQIHRDYDVSSPDIFVHAPALQQAFDNLIRNAGQAMRRTQIESPTLLLRSRIHFSAMIQGATHRMVWSVDIEDNGPGMPQSITEKNHSDGHGLGLSIMRRVVRKQGGEASCNSREGKTRWTLTFPCSSQ